MQTELLSLKDDDSEGSEECAGEHRKVPET